MVEDVSKLLFALKALWKDWSDDEISYQIKEIFKVPVPTFTSAQVILSDNTVMCTFLSHNRDVLNHIHIRKHRCIQVRSRLCFSW